MTEQEKDDLIQAIAQIMIDWDCSPYMMTFKPKPKQEHIVYAKLIADYIDEHFIKKEVKR